MIPEPPAEPLAPIAIEVFALALFIAYFANVVILNTSIGLRMGYNAYRIIPASLVWPVMEVYEPLDEWAKSGECTLPEEHPLRSGAE